MNNNDTDHLSTGTSQEQELDIYSIGIADGLKNQDELICFLQGNTLYFTTFANKAVGGPKRKTSTLESIKKSDFSKLRQIELAGGQISMAENVLVFNFNGMKRSFTLSAREAMETAQQLLSDLSEMSARPIETRKANSNERLKLSLFHILLSVIFAVLSVVVPFYVIESEELYIVKVIAIPFIKIGPLFSFLIFLTCTVVAVFALISYYQKTGNIQTEYIDFN